MFGTYRVHPQGVTQSLITLTNNNMVTKVGHNLKYICCVDKMSLKFSFEMTNKTWLKR
jgi:hypothetical protein